MALGINIINISLGHPPYESAATDPLVQAVEAASRAGTIVVVSAGNVGVNPQTHKIGYGGILSPANAPSAIAVCAGKTMGTIDPTDDLIANYSSRGPSWYDGFANGSYWVSESVMPFSVYASWNRILNRFVSRASTRSHGPGRILADQLRRVYPISHSARG